MLNRKEKRAKNIAKVKELLAKGYDISAIARMMNKTESVVQGWADSIKKE